MTRRRTDRQNLGAGSVILLVVAAVVVTAAGVFHAYVKNRQIHVKREVEKAEQRISQHDFEIETLQMRLDDELNRYLINGRLREIASDLRPIPAGAIEVIRSGPAEGDLPDLAHRPTPLSEPVVAGGP